MEQSIKLQEKHLKTIRNVSEYDLSIQEEYDNHAILIGNIGNNYTGREFRKFDFDDHNKKIFKFLTYYFNNCKLAEEVFKDEGEEYKIHKNLLIIGEPGTGKTITMQIFSDYLKLTGNRNFFQNISVTQMMNYYKMNGHIDKYTYNESEGNGAFEGKPFNVCLNDIGLEIENQKHYGTDLDLVIDEFLYARYEIYQQSHTKYHMTSNLSVDDFKKRFGDRLVDRFKSFNILTLSGKSRRI